MAHFSLSLSSFFLIHTKQTTINIVWSNQILGFPHSIDSEPNLESYVLNSLT
jgi:hypothetical protein